MDLTREDVIKALPPHLRGSVTEEFVEHVNCVAGDPETAQVMRDNFIGYVNVLKEGKFRANDYVHAVQYVSFKLMKYTNQEAYARAFPDRYAALLAKGASEKTISSYVSIYNSGKLVNLILEQTLIPTWVLNADVYQEAINTQAHLMVNAKSELVRTQAANSVLTHLKKPEKHAVELNIGMGESSGLKDLRNMLTDLAEKQKVLIESGATTKQIAHQSLVDVTPADERYDDVEEAEVVE